MAEPAMRRKKLVYTPEEIKTLREMLGVPKIVPESAFQHLVLLSTQTGASIFLGQIHTTPRWNKQQGREIWTPQLSVR
jgi:hypothetical protein